MGSSVNKSVATQHQTEQNGKLLAIAEAGHLIHVGISHAIQSWHGLGGSHLSETDSGLFTVAVKLANCGTWCILVSSRAIQGATTQASLKADLPQADAAANSRGRPIRGVLGA